MKNLTKILLTLAVAVGLGLFVTKGVLAYNERSIVCTGGSYFDRYGPSEYWWEKSNYGWCHNSNNWDENGLKSNESPFNGAPFSMWRTYSGCSISNNARWNMGNIAQWSYWYAFIPSNYATSQYAPYLVTYNGGSSYDFTINQNSAYNRWMSFPTTTNRYQIMNTWLDDDSCESSPYNQIGFDETQICKEENSSSEWCPGSHSE